jgi:hypothetical protein
LNLEDADRRNGMLAKGLLHNVDPKGPHTPFLFWAPHKSYIWHASQPAARIAAMLSDECRSGRASVPR